MEPKPHACCQVEENLGESQGTEHEGLTVRTCSVCGCRHFELNVDPGKLGVRIG